MGKNQGICYRCKGPHTGNHASYCRDCFNLYQRSKTDQYREKTRARQIRNKSRLAEISAIAMRERRRKDPVAANEYTKKYRKEHPEKVKIWEARKKKKRQAKGIFGHAGHYHQISKRRWREICEKYDNRCFYCGKENCKLTVDHAVPLSRGGTHEDSNLRPACAYCNGSKWARTPEEFDEYRKALSIKPTQNDPSASVRAGGAAP